MTAPGGRHNAPVNSSLKPREPRQGFRAEGSAPLDGRGFDLNNPKFRCRDHATVKLWTSWNANTGFVTGDGYVVFDNDEGEDLDRIIERECRKAAGPRDRAAAPVRARSRTTSDQRSCSRVLDFVGDTATVGNQTLKFKRNGKKTELQVLAPGKQFVIGGMHQGTPLALRLITASVVDQRHSGRVRRSIRSGSSMVCSRMMKAIRMGTDIQKARAQPRQGPRPEAGRVGPPTATSKKSSGYWSAAPNRDGGTTPLDDYLDIAENYWNILYAILGALGMTPEARAIWLEWAKGAGAAEARPRSCVGLRLWKRAAPGYGNHLRQLAWRFIGAEYVARQFPEDEAWIEATKSHRRLREGR